MQSQPVGTRKLPSNIAPKYKGKRGKELSEIVEEKKKASEYQNSVLLLFKPPKLTTTACRPQQALLSKTKHKQEVLGKLAKPPGAAQWTAMLE